VVVVVVTALALGMELTAVLVVEHHKETRQVLLLKQATMVQLVMVLLAVLQVHFQTTQVQAVAVLEQ
jgi:hypothetical protein